jgi:hypothetical protein
MTAMALDEKTLKELVKSVVIEVLEEHNVLAQDIVKDEPSQIYTQDYRHFDTLIWQIPTWSSAVFALTATAAGIGIANGDKISLALGFSSRYLLGVFVGTMALVLFLLLNVLIRFRLHHANIKLTQGPQISVYFLVRGHTALLLIVVLECAALFATTLLIFYMLWYWAVALPLFASALLVILAERQVSLVKKARSSPPPSD